MSIKDILESAILEKATDIHLVTGKPPIFRINGEITPASLPSLTAIMIDSFTAEMLSEEQRQDFKALKEIDISYHYHADYFFRVNLHVERGHTAIAIRILPKKLRSPQELGLPEAIYDILGRKKGFVLICGPAGSGKTTTMNVIVDLINSQRRCKIITIEDPIEYIHESKMSLIVQREVGAHTNSFTNALKYALRQDPDVVVIGEIRDLESISMALTTAETGHLVIATLHAPDAIEAINRIIDIYPSNQQNQIRIQLAENLAGIVSQTLIPAKCNLGRALATEVILPSMAIRNMIRRGALIEIRGQMSSFDSRMHTFEQDLSRLCKAGIITADDAFAYAKYPTLLTLGQPDHTEQKKAPKTLSF